MATNGNDDLAWYLCPQCGARLGFVTADNGLLMPGRYTNATLRRGVLVCQCGHVTVWHEAGKKREEAT